MFVVAIVNSNFIDHYCKATYYTIHGFLDAPGGLSNDARKFETWGAPLLEPWGNLEARCELNPPKVNNFRNREVLKTDQCTRLPCAIIIITNVDVYLGGLLTQTTPT